MTKFWAWCKNKFGRIVTGAGSSLLLMETFDISTIKEPIEGLFPKYGHQIVLGIAGICSIASFVRHQYIANKHPAPVVLPPPVNAVKLLIAFTLLGAAMSACIAVAAEVPIERYAPQVDGHPLTSVVITQCSLVIVVYMTMADGRLLRFDKADALPVDQLINMAYSATRSERVEISCNHEGAIGYETHQPI